MATQIDDDEEIDSSNEWSQVVNGRGRGRGKMLREDKNMVGNPKRSLEEISSDEGSEIGCKRMVKEEFKIILKFKNEEENIQLSPIAVSRELKKKIGDIQFAKTLRDGSLLIIVKSEEQKNKILQIDNICKKSVREKKIIGENKITKGVITGIPINEDLEKLKRNVYDTEILKVTRLLRNVDGERVPSMSVLLEFKKDKLPDRIKIGFLSFPVRPYVPPPLRCFKCQRYGHVAEVCRGQQRCPKCGGNHKYEECVGNVQEKCCNCGGQHRVTFGGCEVRKKAAEIQQVKTVNNISYAEALKTVQGQKERTETGKVQQVLTSNKKQMEQEKTEVTVEKIMLFMAYVINCTDQVKHKTEKIKIIVKGAEKF
ncbi:uncharacterized protein LOC106514416, partial [Austrofundulus limnaeus]|uniref:Uncharacterized protein LOC106514416 n=1 Tax=Austrofundulus limnaeus TaxID=52670 RepID=A0A2I4AUG1_AUSLI